MLDLATKDADAALVIPSDCNAFNTSGCRTKAHSCCTHTHTHACWGVWQGEESEEADGQQQSKAESNTSRRIEHFQNAPLPSGGGRQALHFPPFPLFWSRTPSRPAHSQMCRWVCNSSRQQASTRTQGHTHNVQTENKRASKKKTLRTQRKKDRERKRERERARGK